MSSQIDKLPSKLSLILGFVIGILLASTIILSIVLLAGGGRSSSYFVPSNDTPKTVVEQPPDRPIQPDNTGTDITIREISSDDHIRGDKNADITVVEYSDLECPFCKRFHPTMIQLVDEYKGKVRWVYRHFPLDQLHSKARKEAEAIECANELGGSEGFWAYIDELFEITPSNNQLDLDQLPEIAQGVGLDRGKFEACLESGKYAQHIQDDYSDAVSAGGTGTPYSVIIDANGNTFPVSGAVPYNQLKQIIDSIL